MQKFVLLTLKVDIRKKLMESILGVSISVYIGLTVFLFGFSAYMTGQVLAMTWRPFWQVIVYTILLGFADRFLTYSLFQGELVSLTGYLWDTATLMLIGLLSFRFNRTTKMVAQYPWLYERTSPFTWREKESIHSD